jgi:hypothetical protein
MTWFSQSLQQGTVLTAAAAVAGQYVGLVVLLMKHILAWCFAIGRQLHQCSFYQRCTTHAEHPAECWSTCCVAAVSRALPAWLAQTERERKQRHHHQHEADDDSEQHLLPPQPAFAPQVRPAGEQHVTAGSSSL